MEEPEGPSLPPPEGKTSDVLPEEEDRIRERWVRSKVLSVSVLRP